MTVCPWPVCLFQFCHGKLLSWLCWRGGCYIWCWSEYTHMHAQCTCMHMHCHVCTHTCTHTHAYIYMHTCTLAHRIYATWRFAPKKYCSFCCVIIVATCGKSSDILPAGWNGSLMHTAEFITCSVSVGGKHVFDGSSLWWNRSTEQSQTKVADSSVWRSHTSTCAHSHTCMRTYTHTHTHICMHACAHTCTQTCPISHTHARTHAHTHTHILNHEFHMHICMFALCCLVWMIKVKGNDSVDADFRTSRGCWRFPLKTPMPASWSTVLAVRCCWTTLTSTSTCCARNQ